MDKCNPRYGDPCPRRPRAHRLPCHVQVYEVTAPLKFEAASAAIFGSAGPPGRLQPLTHVNPATILWLTTPQIRTN
jgi:hypothetical protein